MGTDYIARQAAKKSRKQNRLAEEGTKRIRKKKQARRLCRGVCYNPPTLTAEDVEGVRSISNPLKLFSPTADGLANHKDQQTSTPAIKPQTKGKRNQTDAPGSTGGKPAAKKAKLSTAVALLTPIDDETAAAAKKKQASKKKEPVQLDPFILTLPQLFQDYMAAEGFSSATSVQQQTWPALLKSRDVEAVAQPGSGKTLAYAVPAMQLLVKKNHGAQTRPKSPLTLVLVPTRELAQQVTKVFQGLRRWCGIRAVCITGGVDKEMQVEILKEKEPHVLVATPGRLLDLVDDGHLTLLRIRNVILDEADKMLSMGFAPQIDRLKDLLFNQARVITLKGGARKELPRPQIGLFTATMPETVRSIVGSWLEDPVVVHLTSGEDADGATSISRTVTQIVHVCAEHKKPAKLLKHLEAVKQSSKNQRNPPRILIFANRIKTVRFVSKQVANAGFRSTTLHGERSQEERTAAVQDFKSGKAQVLVATDVAARGLHIKNLPYVVNYDLPSNLETYVHRVGRTGRLAADGHAYSFMTRELAPIAQAVIDLLQEHDQSIDPNLVKLANAYSVAAKKLGLPLRVTKVDSPADNDDEDNEEEEERENIEDDNDEEEERENGAVLKPRTKDVLYELGIQTKQQRKKSAAVAKKRKQAEPESNSENEDEGDDTGSDGDEAFEEEEAPTAANGTSKATAKAAQTQQKPPKQQQKPIEEQKEFIASKKFAGAKAGYAFKKGHLGVGYYPDVNLLAVYKQAKAGGKPQRPLNSERQQLKAKYKSLPIGGLEAGSAPGSKSKRKAAAKEGDLAVAGFESDEEAGSPVVGNRAKEKRKQLPGRLRKKLAKARAE